MPADRQLIDAIRSGLAAAADPAKAPEMQRYMKSAMPFHGVPKPQRAAVMRAALADRTLDAATWRATVEALWHEATHREQRYAALDLLGDRRYAAHRGIELLGLYEQLIVEGAWWDHVDELAAGRLGELLDREPDATAAVLRTWAIADDSMWKRRAAIIAQVRRKDRTDRALLYDAIEPNRDDREFFIRKGIGWGLRAYAWVDPDEVERYCAAHELQPLSRREALRNLEKARAKLGGGTDG
ncbi:DNA alkylation repair enzyme [Patulibacter medicamentivorans]|uniref:DNA alkylation repair enzyme n=1 Tax=Patulibacter medicamentivorans TaxID=1097667 RepID=H0E1G6_9ACTN|nr:DNA alkylation repair protein [Patulibacter medicamentivorans]EHN12485.1 DNA alkylation repair enzyme [Patulibacter medicamentivorans]